MTGYALSYVALASRDVDAVCRFLGGSLGLIRKNLVIDGRAVPFFGVGRAAVAVFDPEDPYLDAPCFPGVHHMALAVTDPDRIAEHHGLPVTGRGAGPDSRYYVAIDRGATCGIRTRFIEPLPISGQDGPVDRIDHLGIASTDNAEGVRVFVDTLGCPLESTQTDVELRNVTESFVSDKYGVVYHARPTEILGGLRDVFITVGDCELEFLMDFDPAMKPAEHLGERAVNTKGDQSAIAKFIERRGPGLAHIAFRTRDIDSLLMSLAGEGWRMIDTKGRPGGRGSQIGFVHPSNFGGCLVMHFVQPQDARTGQSSPGTP